MRLLVAMMKHETNSFSPVPSDISRFQIDDVLLTGRAALEHYEQTETAIAGFIDIAREFNAKIVIPLAADAWPSGPVDHAAYENMTDKIIKCLSDGDFDGVLLDLHGAMVTTEIDDGEGELLTRMRAIDRDVPIALALDMHANMTREMASFSTIITGYRSYPHIDHRETGRRAAELLMREIAAPGSLRLSWGQAPMMPHIMRQSTLEDPNLALQEHCAALSGQKCLDASLFMGFPHCDIEKPGVSVAVVTEGEAESGRKVCLDLLAMVWQKRTDFIYCVEPLDYSLERAHHLSAENRTGRPVILLDHYDNAASGGTMDTVAVLERALALGLTDLLFLGICDPAAAALAISAGVHATLELEIGGRAVPSARSRSMKIHATVLSVSDGRFVSRGPVERGVQMDMGASALIGVGGAEIIICSKQIEPIDIAAFEALGADPIKRSFVGLKSRVHWRAGLASIAGPIVECAGEGVCSSNYEDMAFRKLRRPIYPLDKDAQFLPEIM